MICDCPEARRHQLYPGQENVPGPHHERSCRLWSERYSHPPRKKKAKV